MKRWFILMILTASLAACGAPASETESTVADAGVVSNTEPVQHRNFLFRQDLQG